QTKRARTRPEGLVPGCAAADAQLLVVGLMPDDLDDPAPVALAIEFEEEDALPGAELELALANRDRLAGRAEQHRHAVGVAVPEVHVLGADVLGGSRPVVVRVVGLARDEAEEQLGEVLEEALLELVHPYAAGGVRGVDAGDALLDAAFADRLLDVLGDVPDGQPAGRTELLLPLEDLHRLITPGAVCANRAYSAR